MTKHRLACWTFLESGLNILEWEFVTQEEENIRPIIFKMHLNQSCPSVESRRENVDFETL